MAAPCQSVLKSVTPSLLIGEELMKLFEEGRFCGLGVPIRNFKIGI